MKSRIVCSSPPCCSCLSGFSGEEKVWPIPCLLPLSVAPLAVGTWIQLFCSFITNKAFILDTQSVYYMTFHIRITPWLRDCAVHSEICCTVWYSMFTTFIFTLVRNCCLCRSFLARLVESTLVTSSTFCASLFCSVIWLPDIFLFICQIPCYHKCLL